MGNAGKSEATAAPRALAASWAPIRGAPVTSLFGMRFHPILHILRLHAGIDFGAPVGSPCSRRGGRYGRVRRTGHRLRQSRRDPPRRFRNVVFAPLGNSQVHQARRQGEAGRCCRPFGQHRPVDRSAPALRVLSQPGRGRSAAASGDRDSVRRGVAGGLGRFFRGREHRAVSGRDLRRGRVVSGDQGLHRLQARRADEEHMRRGRRLNRRVP